jgi:hypothetical protein
MFGALAEFERSLIRERTQAGLAAARRLGRTGGRPSKLTEDDIEAAKRRCWPIPTSPSLKSRSALVFLPRRSIGTSPLHELRMPRDFDNGRLTLKTGCSRRVFLPMTGGGNAPKAVII